MEVPHSYGAPHRNFTKVGYESGCMGISQSSSEKTHFESIVMKMLQMRRKAFKHRADEEKCLAHFANGSASLPDPN